MASELYLARVSGGGDAAHIQERIRAAFTAAGLEDCFREKDLVLPD